MLKRSRKGLAIEITEEKEAIFEGILEIVDETLGTRYHEVYYQVYINPEKLSLEEMAERCYRSRHTLIEEIEVVNQFIQNTLAFLQNRQIRIKGRKAIEI